MNVALSCAYVENVGFDELFDLENLDELSLFKAFSSSTHLKSGLYALNLDGLLTSISPCFTAA